MDDEPSRLGRGIRHRTGVGLATPEPASGQKILEVDSRRITVKDLAGLQREHVELEVTSIGPTYKI